MTTAHITAVMVTGKHPERRKLALASVTAFQQQTYRHKDLLVINDGPQALWPEGPPNGTREIRLTRPPEKPWTLAQLRNIGLEEARGDFIMQWDDDDWYHPQRMEYQLAESDGGAVLLRCQVRYSFNTGTAFLFVWHWRSPPGIPGTILHPRSVRARYREDLTKAEDDWFIRDHFPDCYVVTNSPPGYRSHLYLRFSHQHNTWDEEHIIGKHVTNDGWWRLPADAANYLKQILRSQYAGCNPVSHKYILRL